VGEQGAAGRVGVNVRSYRRVGIKDDRTLLIDGRVIGQAEFWLHRELDKAFADVSAVVGRQEAVKDAFGALAELPVERDVADGQQAGLDVEVRAKVYV